MPPTPTHPPGDELPIRIEHDLTIGRIEACRTHLAARLAKSSHCTLDLAEVSAFDLFGLQLLLAVAQAAKSSGRPFGLVNKPATFAAACLRAGIAEAQFAPPASSPL